MKFFEDYGHHIKNLLLIIIIGLSAFFAYSWFYYENGVVDYVACRDKAAVKQMFKDERETLIHYANLATYSVDFMLDNRSSSQLIKNDKLILKVMRHAGKTVGFTAYYPHSTYWWQLLFVVVDKDHRNKGYASKMIQYDIDDMVKRGAFKITMFTRLDNLKARSLYEGKFGFKDIGHTEDNFGMDLVLYPRKTA